MNKKKSTSQVTLEQSVSLETVMRMMIEVWCVVSKLGSKMAILEAIFEEDQGLKAQMDSLRTVVQQQVDSHLKSNLYKILLSLLGFEDDSSEETIRLRSLFEQVQRSYKPLEQRTEQS